MQATDDDSKFSHALIREAKCLQLTDHCPVGDWEYGQGIRRARRNEFFWELSSTGFVPWGLNPPFMLKARYGGQKNSSKSQAFPQKLTEAFPHLAGWKWNLIDADHSWMARSWSGTWLKESSTLKNENGWIGFQTTQSLDGWSVALGPNHFFVAGPAVPDDGAEDSELRSCLEVFLTPDVLGPGGRISQISDWLKIYFPFATQNGLVLKIECINHLVTHEKALRAGLSCNLGEASFIELCFPFSITERDLIEISNRVKALKG